MAAAAAERCQRPEVIALAQAIVASQQAEITVLQEMLQEREAQATNDTWSNLRHLPL